jgi:hypothetical protein
LPRIVDELTNRRALYVASVSPAFSLKQSTRLPLQFRGPTVLRYTLIQRR